MAYEQHQSSGRGLSVGCAIVTLSDTREPASDRSGQRMKDLLSAAGHRVVHYELIREEPELLRRLLTDLLARDEIDAILTNGGTGISRRDRTIQVIEELLETPLPGFGELFRMLSWEQVGSGAFLSRATGGIAAGKPLLALPGSTRAVELGMTRLILPELCHLIAELRK